MREAEHPSVVLPRVTGVVIGVTGVVFCLVGAASPQTQAVGAFHKANRAGLFPKCLFEDGEITS